MIQQFLYLFHIKIPHSVSKIIHFKTFTVKHLLQEHGKLIEIQQLLSSGTRLKSEVRPMIQYPTIFTIFNIFYITLLPVTMVTESNSLSSYTCCVRNPTEELLIYLFLMHANKHVVFEESVVQSKSVVLHTTPKQRKAFRPLTTYLNNTLYIKQIC